MRFAAFKRAARIRGNRERHTAMLAELEDLYQREQSLRPPSVVQQAARKDSALHDHFTWDAKEARRRLNLLEAGHLIRAVVRVRVMEETREEVQVRALVSMASPFEDEECRVYIDTEEAVGRFGHGEQVLSEIQRDIDAFQAKWDYVAELAGIRSAMVEFTELHSITTAEPVAF